MSEHNRFTKQTGVLDAYGNYNPGAEIDTPLDDLVYFSSQGAGPSGFQGNDPILGPPYAPVDYQLFVATISGADFPRVASNICGAAPGQCGTLYWTIPALNSFAYSTITTKSYALGPYSYWWSLSSDPSTAVLAGTGPFPNVDDLVWIRAANYIWVTHHPSGVGDRPTTAGVAIPGGTSFLGVILFNKDVNPGNFIFTPWSMEPADSIDHWTLERATDNGNSWVMLDGFITPAASFNQDITNILGRNAYATPDHQGRSITSSYFYRLFGYTANGLKFPYNIVGLIHPYTLSVSSIPGGQRLTWTAPTAAEVAAWPTG